MLYKKNLTYSILLEIIIRIESMEKKLIFFIPSIEDGGVEKNLFIVANYLAKKNMNIEVLTCNANKAKYFNKKIKLIGTKNPFWETKPRAIKYLICLILLFFNLVKERSNKLIFAFQANIYAILIAKIFNTKIIVRANSSPSGWSQRVIKNKIYSFIINLADNVMVNSYAFKREFDKKFNIKSKCIYNPFLKFKFNKNIKKKIYKKKSLKILTIGRLTKQKDHMTLLKAIKLINFDLNPELIIIGKGNEFRNLKNFIKDNNLNSKVKLLGYKHKPYNFIKNCDIFILTSTFEGLPNVLLEAQFFKKYIISSDCPTGPKEILLNGKAGDLFRVGDYKMLARYINEYYSNKKKIIKKINYGYSKFYRFDYNLNCKKYYKFILENF